MGPSDPLEEADCPTHLESAPKTPILAHRRLYDGQVVPHLSFVVILQLLRGTTTHDASGPWVLRVNQPLHERYSSLHPPVLS